MYKLRKGTGKILSRGFSSCTIVLWDFHHSVWSIADRAVCTHRVTISVCVSHWTYLFFPRFLVYRIRQVLKPNQLPKNKRNSWAIPSSKIAFVEYCFPVIFPQISEASNHKVFWVNKVLYFSLQTTNCCPASDHLGRSLNFPCQYLFFILPKRS